jgi:hypothetical protein
VNDFKLFVWDNNDKNTERQYQLNFDGDELEVDQFFRFGKTATQHVDGGSAIKGFFLENYAPLQPPIQLKK